MADLAAPQLEVLKSENGRWTILATHVDGEVVRAEPFAQGREAWRSIDYLFRSFARAR